MDFKEKKRESKKSKPLTNLQRRLTRTKSAAIESPEVVISLTNRFTAPVISRFHKPQEMLMEKSSSVESDEFNILQANPISENPTFEDDSYEDTNTALTTQIVSNKIRENIIFQMKKMCGNWNVKILEDIEYLRIRTDNCEKFMNEMSNTEKNIVLLWSAFMRKYDMVEKLVMNGANPNYCDENGYTPLHMSAFSGCLKITGFLLSRKANPKIYTKASSPLHYAAYGCAVDTATLLINNGAIVDEKNVPVEETLLQSAVRCNAVKCLELFVDQGANVNQLGSKGTNAIHLAADLGHDKCLEILLKSPKANPNVSSIKRSKNTTALHLAAEEGSTKCIKLLLEHKADANAKNYRGYTPLHSAAKISNLDCVELLLTLGRADVNATDNDLRTPLHTAIGKSDSNLDVIELLVKRKANINAKDSGGFSPLHLAALEGLSDCVELLIYLGANVTTKNKKGITALNVISRKTPASLDMVVQKLDQAISLSRTQDHSYQEVELKLDFRNIIAHCHPFETRYLKAFIDDGKKEILEHPLCQAFLYLKWNRLKMFYLIRILLYTLKVLILTLFVLLIFNCRILNTTSNPKSNSAMGNVTTRIDISWIGEKSESCANGTLYYEFRRNGRFGFKILYYLLFTITLSEIYTKLYGMVGFSSIKSYFREVQNITEWFEIAMFIWILVFKVMKTVNYPVAAFAILLGWYNLMFMVGQLPQFGAQVEMYNKIMKEFFKLLVTYSFVLIGFTFSFSIIFPNDQNFKNPFFGFTKVLVMMTGEQDLDPLKDIISADDVPFFVKTSAQLMFILFLFIITIVLMNLLVGIAVNDIQALRKTAELSKLVRQTKLIYHIEAIMMTKWFKFWPKMFSNWMEKVLRRMTLISPTGYKVVLVVRPLNPSEVRLPREVMMAAYDLVKSKDKNEISHFYFGDRRNSVSFDDQSFVENEEQDDLKKMVEETKKKIDDMSSEIQELKNLIMQLKKD